MTAKQFFKSNVFKCLVTLFCVLLVSGVLLTCAYGFMEVSKGERLQRAIGKIYPEQTVTIYGRGEGDGLAEISSADKDPKSLVAESLSYGNATVTAAYKITFKENDDVHYLVQSTGKHGFSEGTVTCWIAVNVDEETSTIKNIAKVSVAANKGQSFISKITGDLLESFTKDLPENGFFPDKENNNYVVSGATRSSTAICNSVNGAIDYVHGLLGVEVTDRYESYAYTDYISTKQTSHKVNGNSVTYNIVTEGLGKAGSFKITVTVESGKITAYEITENGSTAESWANRMDPEIKDGTFFTKDGGKTADELKAIVGENGDNVTLDGFESGATDKENKSHATKSNFLCLYAGLFATANYQTALGGNS